MQFENILGVRFDKVTLSEALQKAEQFLYSSSIHTIYTPNPEFLVKAYRDDYFKRVLNSGDLNICDGRGTQLVANKKLERITGVDFLLELCQLAKESGKTIYLLGSGSDETAKKTGEELQQRFPGLKIVGLHKGPVIKELPNYQLEISALENEEILHDLERVGPDIIFVAFGMGKQEKWIYENLSKLSTVKIAMGVGGAFEFISGVIPRAPGWMRKIGLEWVFRLIQEPKRVKRIWNATAIFTCLVLKERLKKSIVTK